MASQAILEAFGRISGLYSNFNKSSAFPICCDELATNEVLSEFAGTTDSFPCKYLSLPLSLHNLRRADLQILIDKIAAKLAGWKGKLLNKVGRLTLINSVLTSIITYLLTLFAPSKWLIKRIDKLRRSFLWKGIEEEAKGGSCAVNWQLVCSPKKYGGLGIKNLSSFSRALRLRWAWFAWQCQPRPWFGMKLPCSESDMQLFHASTNIHLGNGQTVSFWKSEWLDGAAPRDLAPSLFKLARRKNYTVAQAMHDRKWMKGLERISSMMICTPFCFCGRRFRVSTYLKQETPLIGSGRRTRNTPPSLHIPVSSLVRLPSLMLT